MLQGKIASFFLASAVTCQMKQRTKLIRSNGESTCLPPIWPWFGFQTWHHTLVEFVGSHSTMRGFTSATTRLGKIHLGLNKEIIIIIINYYYYYYYY